MTATMSGRSYRRLSYHIEAGYAAAYHITGEIYKVICQQCNSSE